MINEDDLGVESVTTAEAEIESASAANIVTTKKPNETLEAAIFWLFVGGLGWVPFWNGSNELVSWGINAILFPGLAAVYEVSLLIRGESHPIAVRNIALPAGLFAAVTLWTYFQTLDWPHSAVAHPIWEMAAGVLGRPTQGSISVNPDLTNLALLETHYGSRGVLDRAATMSKRVPRHPAGQIPCRYRLCLCSLRIDRARRTDRPSSLAGRWAEWHGVVDLCQPQLVCYLCRLGSDGDCRSDASPLRP